MISLKRLAPIGALSALAALSMAAAPASAATSTGHPHKVAAKACHDAKGHKFACRQQQTAMRSTPAKPKAH